MIDIIIPAYNSRDTIFDTLYSIAYQDIVDKINVFIVDDCSLNDYDEVVSFFSNFMSVSLIRLDINSGPGVARRVGVDDSSSPYLMFIDSDDVLYDSYSVSRLFNNINGYDVVIGNFVEECNGFLLHERDTIWLHGKLYRREFLNKYSINFNDSRMNEDNGFNQLVLLGGARVNYINYNVYIWCNNKDSITRVNNHGSLYDLVIGYIFNINWALNEAILRGFNEVKIVKLAFSSLVTIYSYYLKFGKDEILDGAKEIMGVCDSFFLSDDDKNKLLNNQYKYLLDIGNSEILNPSISFSDFLRRLK